MNCVMAGMVVVMVIIRSHATGTTDVGDVRFWGVLSLAVLVGLAVAYPVNVWLVANHLKHGMGTVRVLGEGGERVEQAAESHMEMGKAELEVTTAQVNAVAVLTIIVLAAGVVIAAALGDFST